MQRKNHIIYLLFGLLVVISSCTYSHIYQKYKKIPDYIWNYNHKVEFEFDIKDTNTNYDILLNLRIASLYLYSNIWMIAELTDPESKTISKKRYEFTLALEDGKWIGKGLGDIIDNQFILGNNIRFSKTGKYKLTFNHDMRIDNLPFVMDVGICVQKSKEN